MFLDCRQIVGTLDWNSSLGVGDCFHLYGLGVGVGSVGVGVVSVGSVCVYV